MSPAPNPERARTGSPTDWRAVLTGAGAGLAISLPAALIAQVADSVAGGDDPPAIIFPLFLVTLLGFGIAGVVAARRRPTSPLRHGSLAALVGFAIVQGVGIARNLAAGNDVSIGAALVNATVACVLGLVGAWWAARRP